MTKEAELYVSAENLFNERIETGRSAVGVRLISMGQGDKVSSIAHVVIHEEE